MSNLLLNIDELNVRHERSEENRVRLFDEILKTCHNKIKKYNSEFKKQDCLYAPPVFILGRPPYNYVELVDYLITSLQKNGLRAEWLSNKKAIYISWRKMDVNMEKYHNHFSTITYSDDLAQHFSVMTINPVEIPTNTKKKKKKGERSPVQHVAMLEYNPGAKDYIPININGLT